MALALGLSALGLGGAEQNASSVFAQNGSRGETRDWRNSNGEIALRGALDVERTLDEAPSEGAPNRVYFIDESGVSKYYRYRHLSAEDRELVDEALDAPASPVAVPTEEPASAATASNQAAGVAAQNAAAEKSDVNAVWAKLRKALLEGDDELANRAFEELAKGAQTPQDKMFLANTRAMTEEYLACFPDGANVGRAGKKAGERRVLKINGVELPFRWAPPGTFAMGCAPNEGADESEKQHEARLTKGFGILETEVTQEMWTVLSGGSNPSAFSGDSNPVENMSWFDCQAALIGMNNLPFITFPHMSPNLQLPAFIFRLPTEAEWEYACRAGTTGPYNVDGQSLDALGWYDGNSGSKTHAVGGKRANAWGGDDMHGNVREWCADWFGDYDAGPQTDPTGPSSGSNRVLRGGSWREFAESCRSAYRSANDPTARDYADFGFRLVLGR